ncbi:MAG: hypothetical protein Q8N26_25110 [Myxococcales bacterium]|nr:hypothetical protein [Myxococcales bacterium]
MLKHLFVGAVGLSSLAFANPYRHPAVPVHQPAPVIAVPAVRPPPPPPPPPAFGLRRQDAQENRDDRFDVRRAHMLMREFELAVARRDVRALRNVEARFENFLDQELAEARFSRDRRIAQNVMNVQRQLSRLTGRIDPHALTQKRGLYSRAVAIAEQDLRDNRQGGFGRRG